MKDTTSDTITDAFLTKIAAELDPVGHEDKDIDNDGDHDSSDKYLMKRRKAIGKAMKRRQMAKEAAACGSTDQPEHKRVPGKVRKKAKMVKQAKMHEMKRDVPQYVGDIPASRQGEMGEKDQTKSMVVDGEKMDALRIARRAVNKSVMAKQASNCGSYSGSTKKKDKKKGAAPKAGYGS